MEDQRSKLVIFFLASHLSGITHNSLCGFPLAHLVDRESSSTSLEVSGVLLSSKGDSLQDK